MTGAGGADGGADVPGSDVHARALGFELASQGVRVRPLCERDLPEAKRICRRAFDTFNASVGLPPEFPPEEVADVPAECLGPALSEDDCEGFVAVDEAGALLGSNAVVLRDGVAAIGPVTVDPSAKRAGAGRLLVQAAMQAAAKRDIRAVRLMQVAANARSFSLYLSLGFDPMPACGYYEGVCTADPPDGFKCPRLSADDVGLCSALHGRACGTPRAEGIRRSVAGAHPTCVVFDTSENLVAYTTGSFLDGHAVAESEGAFRALVVFQSGAVEAARAEGAPLPPTSLHVPVARPGLGRWLARSGFRLLRLMTPMSYGPRDAPSMIYCPSIGY